MASSRSDYTPPSYGSTALRVTGPEQVAVGKSFRIQISVQDPGAHALELIFEGRMTRIEGRCGTELRSSVELVATKPGHLPVQVVTLGAGGTRRQIRTFVVRVTVPMGRPRFAASSDAEATFRRLNDRRYTGTHGAPAGRQNRKKPVPRRKDPNSPKVVATSSLPGITFTPWWIKWFEQGGPEGFDWKTTCADWISGIGPFGEVLKCWLDLYPNVAESLVWEDVNLDTGTVTAAAYPSWSQTRKLELNVAFFYAWEWLHGGLDWFNGEYLFDPPDNQIALADDDSVETGLTKDDAWKLYLGTVAHSLALEIGGFVPWSIVGYNTQDLELLLHSKNFYAAGDHHWSSLDSNGQTKQFHYVGYLIDGWVVPPRPVTAFEFLVNQNILRSDHYKTITRLLFWSQHHMAHWAGGFDAQNMEAYWQYRGWAPASRIMSGTTYEDPDSSYTNGPYSWSVGCHGTSYFYRALMRLANIPVHYYYLEGCGHGMPVFSTISRTLSHGDDVYTYTLSHPPFPPDLLLISLNAFNMMFFGSDGDCGNVGRRVAQIAIDWLPDSLVHDYCDDVWNGASHAEGEVFQWFSLWYTLADLESTDLWGRLADRATDLGFCSPS